MGKVKYGQQYYDYDKGIMTFIAPKQVDGFDAEETNITNRKSGTGYVLLIHPDFLYKHPLAVVTIRAYGFFSYAVNEALHLSEKEEKDVVDIFQKI